MAHLDQIKVQAGEAVNAGDVIGTVGSTGISTGPHVHVEVQVDGNKIVDPELVRGLALIGPG
jgi:murein DD-endopeptidase MepM/ murein hydrolase activator NlpD